MMGILVFISVLLAPVGATYEQVELFLDRHPEMRSMVYDEDGKFRRIVYQHPAMFMTAMAAVDEATTGGETVAPIDAVIDGQGNYTERADADGKYGANRRVELAGTLRVTRVPDAALLPRDPLRRPQHISMGGGRLLLIVRPQSPASSAPAYLYLLAVPAGYEIVTQGNARLPVME